MRAILVAATVAFLAAVLITPWVVRYFRERGFGQMIREDTEHLHGAKAGTPTMGGAAIMLAALVGYLSARVVGLSFTPTGLLVMGTFIAMGIVGFLDDYIKIRMNRNLGLNKTSKFVGQGTVAVVFAYVGPTFGGIQPQLSFTRPFGPELVFWLFLIWVFILLAGTSNAVNLTDGLDGLAAGSSLQVLIAYTLIAFWQLRHPEFYALEPAAAAELAVIAASAMAASAGFLWWNAPPASIFMGDTGSLALGGLIAALALATNTHFLLVLLGGIFVLETLSVMVQVVAFRGFGTRVLQMAPVHHHFEMQGWQETTVIVRFWIIAGIGVAIGLGVFYTDFLGIGGGLV